ncbi:MAG: hypothetical protein EOO77_17215 [Oxalobacteraceae bacterium]|nr:MAG: hypothetical protein EOO77_17215 [Oxalobacteraceae bacterium]
MTKTIGEKTTIEGLHRQVKPASLQAWNLYLQSLLDHLADDGFYQKPNPFDYHIVQWDERPEENKSVGTWTLIKFSLNRGKEKSKQTDSMKKHISEIQDELDAGRIPKDLWNHQMSFKAVKESSSKESHD